MAKVLNSIEILPKISIAWVGRTNVTDRRQPDGRTIAYSEREREFTFAKNELSRLRLSKVRALQTDRLDWTHLWVVMIRYTRKLNPGRAGSLHKSSNWYIDALFLYVRSTNQHFEQQQYDRHLRERAICLLQPETVPLSLGKCQQRRIWTHDRRSSISDGG